MAYKKSEEKYTTDPDFRALVDAVIAHILRSDFTPSEIRELAHLDELIAAAVYGAFRVEQMRVRPLYVRTEPTDEDWDELARQVRAQGLGPLLGED